MQITINLETSELSATDRQILSMLSGGDVSPARAPKAAPAKAAPATKKAEPAAAESADGPSLQDAVDAATKLVSEGKAALVKAALSAVGSKRVSELSAEDIPGFLDALDV